MNHTSRYLITLLLLALVFTTAQCQDKAKIEKLLEFVKVKGGTYTMGDNSLNYSQWVNYSTEHKERVRGFYMQKTEVTWKLWYAVMGNLPYWPDTIGNKPITKLNYSDCERFVRKLNSITKKKYRLPTEVEWEYAARGGRKSKGFKYAGSDNLDEVGWFEDNSNNTLQEVAQKKPNELGLYDMSGNLSEYCQDFQREYKIDKKDKKPGRLIEGSHRVVRGGSWRGDAEISMNAYRYRDISPKCEEDDCGFRLVLSMHNKKSIFLSKKKKRR
jgi:formylglycine-generating enzyme required for sulfatase activity